MKFKGGDRIVDVKWKDGAVIKVKKLLATELLRKDKNISKKFTEYSENKDDEAIGMIGLELMLSCISGWTGIIIDGPDGKEIDLPYNEENKAMIFDEIISDQEFLKKFMIAARSAVQNLMSGSTVSTTTDGVQATV